jgi:small redox-active disulfide protein 2
MKVSVLGPGCVNCKRLEQNVRDAVAELAVQAEVEKVTDFKDIMAYGVMKTPGLVIDGVVKVSGRVPSKDEIKQIIQGK